MRIISRPAMMAMIVRPGYPWEYGKDTDDQLVRFMLGIKRLEVRGPMNENGHGGVQFHV